MSEESLALQPIAEWNTQMMFWSILRDDLFCELSLPYVEIWPTSGMTRNGLLYELPTQVRLTTGRESSLLRSPTASEGSGGALGEKVAKARGNTVHLRDQLLDLVAEQGLQVTRADRNDLLPTPTTMEHREIKTPEQIAKLKKKSPGGYRNLREVVVNELDVNPLAEVDVLLPTPSVAHLRNHDEPVENYLGRRQDYLDGKTKGMPGASLGVALRMELFPTPTARDFKDGTMPYERRGKIAVDTLGRAVINNRANGEINFGRFTAAVNRWEQVTGREAPPPTKPDGKDGAHRLSSEFTEWMMGLPDGWITGVGLSRKDELKCCGNGVVPQQAELALTLLLEDFDGS